MDCIEVCIQECSENCTEVCFEDCTEECSKDYTEECTGDCIENDTEDCMEDRKGIVYDTFSKCFRKNSSRVLLLQCFFDILSLVVFLIVQWYV